MKKLTLVIGNKNYSSWSLRAWLLLKEAGIPFNEIKISLHTNDPKLAKHSPSGKVPVLIDGKIKIWESLSICEYIAERYPKAVLWPKDIAARAFARSISSEMHAGFIKLRKYMPMDCRAESVAKEISQEVQEDINRITEIWRESRKRFGKGGKFLFGRFGAADAMFAPVAIRFATYLPPLDPVSEKYMETILSLSTMKEWIRDAKTETEVI